MAPFASSCQDNAYAFSSQETILAPRSRKLPGEYMATQKSSGRGRSSFLVLARNMFRVGSVDSVASAKKPARPRNKKNNHTRRCWAQNNGLSTGFNDIHTLGCMYLSGGHILVNRERLKRGLQPLKRSVELDSEAKSFALRAAQMGDVKSVDIPDCRNGHVLCGKSVLHIHEDTMKLSTHQQERQRLLHATCEEYGMATQKGEDGMLYLCQLLNSQRLET